MKKKIKNKRLSKLSDMIISLYHLDVLVYAGNASYFLILAVFPTIMLLLNLLSYTTLNSTALLDILEKVVPSALLPSVERLLGGMFASSSGTMVSVTALAALWAASRGMYGILVGLNRVYGVTEDRSYIVTRSLSILYTFLFLLVLVLTLALHVFGQMILDRIPVVDIAAVNLLLDIISNRVLVLLVLQSVIFTAMYMFLPNRRNKLILSLPGAVLASLGWQGFSALFSVYVDHSVSYSTIYGSLTSICIAMLWLYTCVAILFYGGALNKYLSDIGYRLKLRRQQKNHPQDDDYDNSF